MFVHDSDFTDSTLHLSSIIGLTPSPLTTSDGHITFCSCGHPLVLFLDGAFPPAKAARNEVTLALHIYMDHGSVAGSELKNSFVLLWVTKQSVRLSRADPTCLYWLHFSLLPIRRSLQQKLILPICIYICKEINKTPLLLLHLFMLSGGMLLDAISIRPTRFCSHTFHQSSFENTGSSERFRDRKKDEILHSTSCTRLR